MALMLSCLNLNFHSEVFLFVRWRLFGVQEFQLVEQRKWQGLWRFEATQFQPLSSVPSSLARFEETRAGA
jgi:hypothetical protein